jgi:hypothetical protein
MMGASFFRTLGRLDSRTHENIVRATQHWQLAQMGGDVQNAKVVVDKSMAPSRYLELTHTRRAPEVHLVHLIRDGRANMYSHMRRFGTSPAEAAREWKRVNRRVEWVRRLWAPEARVVQYEDLCRNPSGVCQDILGAMGASVSEAPSLDGSDHMIGGNPDRFTGYESVQLDERWKTGLHGEDLRTFERVAGPINRRYGYEPFSS